MNLDLYLTKRKHQLFVRKHLLRKSMTTDFLWYFAHCVLKVLSCPKQLFLLQLPWPAPSHMFTSHTRNGISFLYMCHASCFHCSLIWRVHDESHFSVRFHCHHSPPCHVMWLMVLRLMFGLLRLEYHHQLIWPAMDRSGRYVKVRAGIPGTVHTHTLTFRGRPGCRAYAWWCPSTGRAGPGRGTTSVQL